LNATLYSRGTGVASRKSVPNVDEASFKTARDGKEGDIVSLRVMYRSSSQISKN